MTAKNDVFRKKARAFVQAVRERPVKAATIIGLNVLRGVVFRSPVDTGRFRGNWFVQSDTAPQTTGADKSGGETVSRGAAQLQALLKSVPKVYILNHLPYAEPLEYGHSQQAPGGMVRITVAEFEQFVRAAGEEVKK